MAEASKSDPVGSDMESAKESYLLNEPSPPPWSVHANLRYCATGRQALKLVADSMWEAGYRTLLVPEFLCDTMLAPFLHEPWDVICLPVTENLNLSIPALIQIALAQPEPPAVLLARYFGADATNEYVDAISLMQESGASVVDDETHRLFRPGRTSADYSIGSLRKLLPVASGAYVSTRSPTSRHVAPVPPAALSRWRAMDQKSAWLETSQGVSDHHTAFGAANASLERTARPSLMDERSSAQIHLFDYQALAQRRRANRDVLREATRRFSGVEFLGVTSAAEVPSHELLVCDDPISLQARLAREGVYCPIHWPPSELLPRSRLWPSHHLSVPIDHRYGSDHMEKVASILGRLCTTGGSP